MKWKRFCFIIICVLLLSGIFAATGESDNYDSETKVDSGASGQASSDSFFQRFFLGIQSVARYVSDSFSGRFGVLSDSSLSEVEISDCGVLNSPNTAYSLNTSVSSAGTCFTILAYNVSLNCQGNSINYSQSVVGYGIYTDQEYSQVFNCNIYNGNLVSKKSYGVYGNNSDNLYIHDNNITSYGLSDTILGGHGIYLESGENVRIVRNKIISFGRSSHPILVDGTNGLVIRNNNLISQENVTSLIFSFSFHNTNITLNNFTSYGSSSKGIWIIGAASSINVSNNLFELGLNSRGIEMAQTGSVDVFVISGNLFRSDKDSFSSIFLRNINNSIISNNTMISTGSFSRGIYATKFDHSNIFNNSIYLPGFDSYGLYLAGEYNQENAIFNNIISTYKMPLTIYYSNKTLVYNNIFNSSSSSLIGTTNSPEYLNRFNTSLQEVSPAKNIIGGNYMGGNYYFRTIGGGFSQTCADLNQDGICDSPYVINQYNIDYHPLAIADNIPPEVSIMSPSNESFVNGPVSIIANATDNSAISRVLFQYSNSTVSWTDLSGCDLTSKNYGSEFYRCIWQSSLFSDDEDGYNIRVLAYDTQNNSAYEINKYYIDRTRPIVHELGVIYPGTQSSVRNGQNINLTAIVTDSPSVSAGISHVQANLNNLNGTGLTNLTFVSGSLASDFNSTWSLETYINGLTGNRLARIWVYDAAVPSKNNIGSNWIINIDNDAPSYSNLESSSGVYNFTLATFSVLAQDNYLLDSYILSTNQNGLWQNESLTKITGTSVLIQHQKIVYTGTFQYKFYLFDDAGNMAETSTEDITVLGNSPEPVINLISPLDHSILNFSDISFQYSYSGLQVNNCTLMIDGNPAGFQDNPQIDSVLIFDSSVSEGLHNWLVSCMAIENVGDINVTMEYLSEINNLEVDLTPPIIDIISPLNQTYEVSDILINVSSSNDVDSCYYSLNSQTNVLLPKSENSFSSLLSLSPGSYNINFICNDIAGNSNQSLIDFEVNYPDITISLNYPNDGSEIVRGKNSVTWEDDLGVVPDYFDVGAKVQYFDSSIPIEGASCFFYLDSNYLGSSFTNSTGDCSIQTSKDISVGKRNLLINYSYEVVSTDKIVSNITSSFELVSFSFPNYIDGKGVAIQFVDNQTAFFYFNVSKTNSTGTFLYDPLNLHVNATDSADKSYPESSYVEGYRLNKTAYGQYEIRVVVNRSFGTSFLRFKGFASDDSFLNYIGSFLHTDIQIVDGPICGNGLLETGEDCDDGNTLDGDSCPANCLFLSPTPPGGGGNPPPTCTDECVSGSVENFCSGNSLNTRTCGNFDSDSCTEWSSWSSDICPSGTFCSESSCKPILCQNECNPGDSQDQCIDSQNSRFRTCGNFNSDPCYEWSDWSVNKCSNNEVCLGRTGICTPLDEEEIKCYANRFCGEWSECFAFYDLNNVLQGELFSEGYQERVCEDVAGCKIDRIERRVCSISIPIQAKKVTWCYQDYVEIYDRQTNQLVSRFKETPVEDFSFSRIDISILASNQQGYCDYCYNGVQDYDETGVDCGGSCSACLPEFNFFNWLIWVVWSLWLLFGVLIMAEVVNDRRAIYKEVDEIKKIGRVESRFEKRIEIKVERFFKGIFKRKVVAGTKDKKAKSLVKNIETKKAEIIERKTKVKEKKKKIKSIKREIRKRKILSLMRKLRLWRKQGYYGTVELEKELKKLKGEN